MLLAYVMDVKVTRPMRVVSQFYRDPITRTYTY